MQQIYRRTPLSKYDFALWHRCSPVNLLHIFRTPFPRNTSGWLLLNTLSFSFVKRSLLEWEHLIWFLRISDSQEMIKEIIFLEERAGQDRYLHMFWYKQKPCSSLHFISMVEYISFSASLLSLLIIGFSNSAQFRLICPGYRVRNIPRKI